MLRKFKIPKTLIWVANLLVIFWIIFTLFRMVTFLVFCPSDLTLYKVLPSFWMGIRYDLRWIAIILLPIVLLSIFPKLSPFNSVGNKRKWTWYLAIVTLLVFFFFAASFGSFSYNRTPLDAGAMNFAEDFTISVTMIWQTYPLLWLLAGLGAAVLLFKWMYHKSYWQVVSSTDGMGIQHDRRFFIASSLFFIFLIYGSIGLKPLTRADSFKFKTSFQSYLAINPLQNFIATLKLRSPNFNEAQARRVFPELAKWMDFPANQNFNYIREIGPRSTSFESRPNIVLVQCESYSMYKSTMSGNPLNASPYFDSLSRQGVFFSRCFSPHFSTARALFAILSGIPDVQFFKFSSRNPEALDQFTIINQLDDYEKHYFLGGNAEFNNFEGVLKNIDGLTMHTGANFNIPPVNVWGISDKDLFSVANGVFTKATKPFFAYIQTSGNHRPYQKSIPEKDSSFVKLNVPDDTLHKYGFESLDEFNSYRYSDFCFRSFIEEAKKQAYFSNTIFVFVGDHGLAGNANAVYPSIWTDQRLTDEHVPLLFYAPQLLASQKRTEVVSQIDILPTIAGLLHRPYENRTLGRDLLDPKPKKNFALVTNAADMVGVITDNYYFTRNINSGEEQVFSMAGVPLTTAQKQGPQKELSSLTTALFETAKYMLVNNRRH